MELAPRARRYLATIVDLGICILITLAITSFALPGIMELIFGHDRMIIYNIWSFIDFIRWVVVSTVFIFSYFALIPIILPGQTIGKRMFGIKVVKKDGSEVTFTTMFVREIIGRILFDFTSFGITTILSIILINKRERVALNDVLADTIVIMK